MKRSQILTILNKIRSEQLVEIYRRDAEDDFSVGYIIHFDFSYIEFLSVDDEGKKNGINIFSLASVLEIITDTKYLQRVSIAQKIAEIKNYSNPFNVDTVIDVKGENILLSGIEKSINEDKVVLLSTITSDEMILGKIASTTSRELVIAQFVDDDFDHSVRKTISLNTIDIFEFDSFETLIIEYYLDHQESFNSF